MSDLPERIWVKSSYGCKATGYWHGSPILPNKPENIGTEYVRADLARPRVKPLVDASENLIIAIGMGWDLDGCIENVQAALAALEE